MNTKPFQTKTTIINWGKRIYCGKLFQKLDFFSKRNTNTNHTIFKIYPILCDSYTFVNAYGKISKNKGALTKGISEDTELMKFYGFRDAEKIAKDFKTNQYKWNPTRRTWIPKPGKKTLRPIDTPTQRDRIVLEAILLIL